MSEKDKDTGKKMSEKDKGKGEVPGGSKFGEKINENEVNENEKELGNMPGMIMQEIPINTFLNR